MIINLSQKVQIFVWSPKRKNKRKMHSNREKNRQIVLSHSKDEKSLFSRLTKELIREICLIAKERNLKDHKFQGITVWNKDGDGEGEFMHPNAIELDRKNNRVFVSNGPIPDVYKHSVQVFD